MNYIELTILQQQDQSEQSNEWPSVQPQPNSAVPQQPHENDHHVQRDQAGNAYNHNPRDSHHSQHVANGGGYSVANTQNYLGQSGKKGYQHYSDSDQSNRADDDMW
jgi:hypothetical protein